MMFSVVGCSSQGDEPGDTNVELSNENGANEGGHEDEEGEGMITMEREYSDMIKSSLISAGNNYRLKNAMEKAQNGEDVTIAYIGGSITEGASSSSLFKSYAYLSYLHFKETFGSGDGSHVKFVNAGMGGTPSSLGVMRYERDVITYGKGEPDILFIEFAVNDYNEATWGRAYESLVVNTLNTDNDPAVVLLFSVFQSRWNMQDDYIPIGRHYDLPMISIKDAVVPQLESGDITDEQFFADQYHPTDFGHDIMADSIRYLFDLVHTQPKASADITMPTQAVKGHQFVGVKMLEAHSEVDGVTIQPGSFTSTDEALVTLSYAPRKTFPNNWKHSPENGSESFKVTLNAKNILLVYKESSDESFGTAEVYIDGERVRTINSHAAGGWNNPQTVLVLDAVTAEQRELEVRMAEGHEDKAFTIMAIGYTE